MTVTATATVTVTVAVTAAVTLRAMGGTAQLAVPARCHWQWTPVMAWRRFWNSGLGAA